MLPGSSSAPGPGRLSHITGVAGEQRIEQPAAALLVDLEPEGLELLARRLGLAPGEIRHADAHLAHDPQRREGGAAPGRGGRDVDDVRARLERDRRALKVPSCDRGLAAEHRDRGARGRDAPGDPHAVLPHDRGVGRGGQAEGHARLGAAGLVAAAGGERGGAGEGEGEKAARARIGALRVRRRAWGPAGRPARSGREREEPPPGRLMPMYRQRGRRT